MKNKLLLTTAIAGTFAFAGASFAETKVVGNLETTINATSSDTAINSGRGIDAETNIGLEGSKELDNGLTAKYGFMIENGDSDTEFLTVGTDVVNVAIGTDFGNNLSQTAVPHVGDQAGTVAGAAGTVTGSNIPVANAHNASHVGVNINAAGGTITARYTPDVGNTRGTASNISGDAGDSAQEYMYSGNLGVEGLKLIIGHGTQDAQTDSGAESGKHQKLSAAYNFGAVSVGAEKQKSETAAAAASQVETDTNKGGISFAVSDSVTLGLNYQETEKKTGGVKSADDEKITMVSIGYNMGGLGIQIQYADISDLGNATGVDAEALQIRTIQKF